jgi:hypothetical protein
MASFDQIPQARVVRKGGQLMAVPPAPREDSVVGLYVRNALAIAFGLWPLTAVMLLMAGLLIMAGHAASL